MDWRPTRAYCLADYASKDNGVARKRLVSYSFTGNYTPSLADSSITSESSEGKIVVPHSEQDEEMLKIVCHIISKQIEREEDTHHNLHTEDFAKVPEEAYQFIDMRFSDEFCSLDHEHENQVIEVAYKKFMPVLEEHVNYNRAKEEVRQDTLVDQIKAVYLSE